MNLGHGMVWSVYQWFQMSPQFLKLKFQERRRWVRVECLLCELLTTSRIVQPLRPQLSCSSIPLWWFSASLATSFESHWSRFIVFLSDWCCLDGSWLCRLVIALLCQSTRSHPEWWPSLSVCRAARWLFLCFYVPYPTGLWTFLRRTCPRLLFALVRL